MKRDKIIENRRKKETGAPYGSLDNYSSSSVDEMTYSPEAMKPSMKSMNNELLNPNYSLSVSEGKGFFNSLYLLEQYQNQYQNFMSGKSPKESIPPGPYSTMNPHHKVPNHHSAEDIHGGLSSKGSVESVLRSPPPMATTSNSSPLLNGYQGIYPKGLEAHGKHNFGDYGGYGPFNQHHPPPHHPSHHPHHRPATSAAAAAMQSAMSHRPQGAPPQLPSNGHANGGQQHLQLPTMPSTAQIIEKPETPIRALPSPFYQKQCTPETASSGEMNRGHMSEISSNSSDSSYHFNQYYQEKNMAVRSRSESQITPSPGQLPNGKSPQLRLNGSTDSGFTTKENGKCSLLAPCPAPFPAVTRTTAHS